MKLIVSLTFLFLISCSTIETKSVVGRSKQSFLQQEEGGKFLLEKETGIDKAGLYVLKRRVSTLQEDNVLERTISFSKFKKLDKDVKGLFPVKSQATFILNNEKYISTMKMNEKSLNVTLISPDEKWNGVRTFKLPKNTLNFCYLYKIIDCAKVTGFLDLASEKGFGSMPVTLVIGTYPFFSDQFLNVDELPFLSGELVYDGKNKSGEHRLSLNLANQVIFYFLDKDYGHLRTSWVAQNFNQLLR